VIDIECANVQDVVITRPDRSGPGGDIVGTPTSVVSATPAIYVPTTRRFRTPDGRDDIIRGEFFIDPVDSLGAVRDVHVGDLLSYTDFAGNSVQNREIIRVEPVWICGDLDSLNIAIGGALGVG
jgi:hypothetical protein